VAILPQRLRSLTPVRLRDDVRLRALAVGLGLIPPRTMHSPEDARVLLEAAQGARRVVEIGVYEGASALALQRILGAGAELHPVNAATQTREEMQRVIRKDLTNMARSCNGDPG